MLLTVLAFIIALGTIITFHEFGHYYVAKRCGVKVLRFSIGFGKIIYSRHDKHGTEWAVSAIPLGGYVKMLDSVPEHASQELKNSAFPSKKLWQKTAIVAAGPAANFILAIFLYIGINLIGTHEPAAIIAEPPSNSVASSAGLHQGLEITAVNDTKVDSFNQLRWELIKYAPSGGTVNIKAQTTSGAHSEHNLSFNPIDMDAENVDFMQEIGLLLNVSKPHVSGFADNSPALIAGINVGDTIVRVNQNDINNSTDLIDQISSNPNQELTIGIQRNNDLIDFKVTPSSHTNEAGQEIGRIGVMLNANVEMTLVRYGIMQGSYLAIKRTVSTAWFSLKMLGRMVIGNVSLKNISGPVTIADYAGKTARTGIISYIGFMALISISIGILNLLPIPMLDGGHLMYYAIEAVRGKPVPEKYQEQGHRIGFAVLMALMGLAFFNDLTRLFT